MRSSLKVARFAVPKKCERCEIDALPGERFCGACRSDLLADMMSSGYLETGGNGAYTSTKRTAEMMERIRDTKFGIEE